MASRSSSREHVASRRGCGSSLYVDGRETGLEQLPDLQKRGFFNYYVMVDADLNKCLKSVERKLGHKKHIATS
jgi:hypothetical protein